MPPCRSSPPGAFCSLPDEPFGAEFAKPGVDRGESRSGYRPSTQSVRGNGPRAQILRDCPGSGGHTLPGLRVGSPWSGGDLQVKAGFPKGPTFAIMVRFHTTRG